MTADDMVSVPRELAERVAEALHDYEPFSDVHNELDAILNPPPEFDPAAVEAFAAYRYRVSGGRNWDACPVRAQSDWLANARDSLTVLRDAGWEMVETTELAALRELVAASWGDVGGAFIEDQMTKADADAIRKARAAQR